MLVAPGWTERRRNSFGYRVHPPLIGVLVQAVAVEVFTSF